MALFFTPSIHCSQRKTHFLATLSRQDIFLIFNIDKWWLFCTSACLAQYLLSSLCDVHCLLARGYFYSFSGVAPFQPLLSCFINLPLSGKCLFIFSETCSLAATFCEMHHLPLKAIPLACHVLWALIAPSPPLKCHLSSSEFCNSLVSVPGTIYNLVVASCKPGFSGISKFVLKKITQNMSVEFNVWIINIQVCIAPNY